MIRPGRHFDLTPPILTIDMWSLFDNAGGGGGTPVTPGGSPTQLQYDNAGVFGGITGSSFDGTVVGLGPLAVTGTSNTVMIVGPELVVNGSFTGSAANWTLGTGWTYGSNKVTHAAGASGSLVQSGFTLTSPHITGHSYRITYTVSGMTAGNISATAGDSDENVPSAANGTVTGLVTARDPLTALVLSADAAFDGSIDDVSVKEVQVLDVGSTAFPNTWIASALGNVTSNGNAYLGQLLRLDVLDIHHPFMQLEVESSQNPKIRGLARGDVAVGVGVAAGSAGLGSIELNGYRSDGSDTTDGDSVFVLNFGAVDDFTRPGGAPNRANPTALNLWLAPVKTSGWDSEDQGKPAFAIFSCEDAPNTTATTIVYSHVEYDDRLSIRRGNMLLRPAHCDPNDPVHNNGGDLRLSGGVGKRTIAVNNFTLGAGDTITLTIDGVSTVLTEGVNFTAAVSNAATATSITAAVNALYPGKGVKATANSGVVWIFPAALTTSLHMATSDPAFVTLFEGPDGTILMDGLALQMTGSGSYIKMRPFNGSGQTEIELFNAGVLQSFIRNKLDGGGNPAMEFDAGGNVMYFIGKPRLTSAIISADNSVNIGNPQVGEMELWSEPGVATFIQLNERTVANRGSLGFAAGSSALAYRSGATTMANGTEVFSFDTSGSSISSNLALTSSSVLKWSTDTGLARNAAGVVEINNGTPGTFRDLQLRNLLASGTVTNYKNVATAGWGVPAIYANGRATGQTGANSSIAAYTPAADGSFEVSMNILVTAFTAGTISGVVTYTDEGGTGRSLTMTFSSVGGVLGTTVGAAGAFEGVPLHIRAKASNAITVTTTVSVFTGTYNVEGIIRQLA